MLEKSREAYYNSKSVRKKFIMIAIAIFVVVVSIFTFIGLYAKVEQIIPLSVVFGGLGAYIFYYVKTNGYKHLYEIYFRDIISDLATSDDIHVRDLIPETIDSNQIIEIFEHFKDDQVSTMKCIQFHIDGVEMNVTHARVVNLDSKTMKPIFDGTILSIDRASTNHFTYDKETLYDNTSHPQYLKRVRDALGDDVALKQTEDKLYVATTKKLTINSYQTEFYRRYGYALKTIHYDDLYKVVDSWKYFKVLKKILID